MNRLDQRARITRGDLGGARWEVATRCPAPRLRLYARDYTGYAERTPTLLRRRELPGPHVVVIVELGPSLRVLDRGDPRRYSRYPGGFVVGLHESFTLTEHDGFQRGLQLDLTPIGARLLFGVPMVELTGRVVSLRDLLPREHRSFSERLAALPDWDSRFDLVDRVFIERLAEAGPRTTLVEGAVRQIEEHAGAIDMRALARQLGYSPKHVIDLFRDQVGVPPKRLARIVRFARLIQHLKAGTSSTWAELALELGYYDQAHLAREVKQFTGTTPTRARAELIDLTSLPE